MTKFKTSAFNEPAIDLLDDAALESVVGGANTEITPGHPLPTMMPASPMVFRDVFAKYTIGT
jgi:hypothetical protein